MQTEASDLCLESAWPCILVQVLLYLKSLDKVLMIYEGVSSVHTFGTSIFGRTGTT